MAANAAVDVKGLDDFRKNLRKASDPKAVRAEFKEREKAIADHVATAAGRRAASLGGMPSHWTKVGTGNPFRGKATAKGAAVYPWQTRTFPAYWGAKPGKRSGWNRTSYLRKKAKTHTTVRTNAKGRSSARAVRTRRHLGGKAQFPAWVGNQWEAGSASGGPYALNAEVHSQKKWILDQYGEAMQKVAKKAFPK